MTNVLNQLPPSTARFSLLVLPLIGLLGCGGSEDPMPTNGQISGFCEGTYSHAGISEVGGRIMSIGRSEGIDTVPVQHQAALRESVNESYRQAYKFKVADMPSAHKSLSEYRYTIYLEECNKRTKAKFMRIFGKTEEGYVKGKMD